jgi:3-deoxy-D-manno-octulosonic-acid transferase
MGPAYRITARVIHRLPFPRSTLAASLAGRAGAWARWRGWAAARRRAEPLVWVHAPSVGEALMLAPIIGRLRARSPSLQFVLTHTSPSVAARAWRDYRQVDFLPLDEPGPVTATLEALRPDLLLFGRGDLWPELVTRAADAGVPVVVAGATVRPRSGRLRWPIRRALAAAHREVCWLGAVTGDDAERWRRMGVATERIEVTGDPRHDHVVERILDVGEAVAAARAWARGLFTVVAGSVERADESMLARVAARRRAAGWRWLVVPHDPDERTVERLTRVFRDGGCSVGRWEGLGGDLSRDLDAVVVARRGVLADLYLAADAAFVGGGGRPGRLHAVCEPAALGLPVVAGPHASGDRDFASLARGGGAVRASDDATLGAALDAWATGIAQRHRAGLAARAGLDAGAAERTAARITPLLTDTSG